LITLLSFGAIVATNGSDLSLLLFQYFIATPAIGGVFLAGFLAPRASWLLGRDRRLVAAICYSILVIAFPRRCSRRRPRRSSRHATWPSWRSSCRRLFGALLASGARGIAASCASRRRSGHPRTTEGRVPGDGRTRTAGRAEGRRQALVTHRQR
jgi:hypothetical protein